MGLKIIKSTVLELIYNQLAVLGKLRDSIKDLLNSI